jgi:peptidoglycan/xylan/chitin deacetylase (PgdA/CDA1 family)
MSDWKPLVRDTLCGACKWTGALRLGEAVLRAFGQEFMTVLLFHRVSDAIPEDGLTVSTARFVRICKLLASGFHVVPLAEVFRLVRAGADLPRRTVALTFDDCYRDNLAASRILAEHGLTATFFLPTAYVGTDRTFDWDRHLPRLPNLDWDDVRAMVRLGMDVGSHTVNHANLGVVNAEQALAELVESRVELERQLARPVRWFAYPYGEPQHLRPEYAPLIREAGYDGVVSGYGGFVWPGCDGTVLPREAVPWFRSLAHLEMHLSGCLHFLYALRGRPGSRPAPFGETAGDHAPRSRSTRDSTAVRSISAGQ